MQTCMPKTFAGTGVVRFQCSEGAYNRMRMANMPTPSDWGETIGGYTFVRPWPRTMPADSVRYRVVWPSPPGTQEGKLPTTSFSLGGNHSNQTLFVLAQFLRDQGVEFVGLANKNGSRFKAAGLQGL